MENREILAKRAIKGAFTLTARKFFLQVVSYVGGIFLARLLTPEIFGIFAIVSFVINFFSLFADAGLGAALIQKKEELKEKDLKVAFTLQQAIVLILLLLIFIFSPLIIKYYHLSQNLVWLLRAFSLSLFLTSLKTIPLILLERELRFNLVIIPEIVEVISFQILAVFLAYMGFGVWSFIIALLTRTFLGLIVLYLLSPWKIGLCWDFAQMKKLFTFGISYQANGFIAMVKDAVLPVFVASVCGATAVGYLNWANTFSKIPLIFMNDIFRITFPGFARIQSDKELLRKALEKTLKFTNLFLFPVTFLLIASASQIVHLIFTDKWLPALPAFYIHSLGILVVGVSNTFMNTFWACAKLRIAVRLMVFYALLNWLISVPLVYLFGFNGAMIGSVVVLFVSLPVNSYYLKKIVSVNIFNNVWFSFLSAALAGLLTYFLSEKLVDNLISLFFVLFVGGLSYLLFIFLFGGKSLTKEIYWLWQKIKK